MKSAFLGMLVLLVAWPAKAGRRYGARSYSTRHHTVRRLRARSLPQRRLRSRNSTRRRPSSPRFWSVGRSHGGGEKRSEAAKDAFKQGHPCPSSGKGRGPCPGYVIDHVNPLACGGTDAPSNMQWQTVEAAKAKDQWERKGCK